MNEHLDSNHKFLGSNPSRILGFLWISLHSFALVIITPYQYRLLGKIQMHPLGNHTPKHTISKNYSENSIKETMMKMQLPRLLMKNAEVTLLTTDKS